MLMREVLALTLAGAAVSGCRALPPDAPLTRAAAAGDVARIESLLKGGADPNLEDGTGWAPLHHAARQGHAEAAAALLRAGAKADRPDRRHGWTPLMHAIHKRRNAAAMALLDGGADPSACGGHRVVPRISGALLESRHGPENRSCAGGRATPLIMAAGCGNTELVRELLRRGADPYAEAGDGLTALWSAVGGGAIADITDGPPLGTCFPETVKALLEKAPELRLKATIPTRAARLLGRSKACDEAFALADRGKRS